MVRFFYPSSFHSAVGSQLAFFPKRLRSAGAVLHPISCSNILNLLVTSVLFRVFDHDITDDVFCPYVSIGLE